jgi:formate/nitrite transporter FocA (FNT family)
MLPSYIKLLSLATYAIYVIAIATGIMICISVGWQIKKLTETPQATIQSDTNVTSLVCRFMFGIALICINAISMATVISLGASSGYVKDPYSQLGYMTAAVPSEGELAMALFVTTLSRCMGAYALSAGLKHGQHSAHPQEQIRKSARWKVFWGVLCGAIFIYPEFWMKVAENNFSFAAYFSELFSQL